MVYGFNDETKEKVEVPTKVEYLEHEITAGGGQRIGEIALGHNASNGLIVFSGDAPTQASVNAGSIQDVKIMGYGRSTTTGWDVGKVQVFVTKTNGTADCHIDAAGMLWDATTSKYWVMVRLKNLTSSNVDYDGTTNIMIVDWN